MHHHLLLSYDYTQSQINNNINRSFYNYPISKEYSINEDYSYNKKLNTTNSSVGLDRPLYTLLYIIIIIILYLRYSISNYS